MVIGVVEEVEAVVVGGVKIVAAAAAAAAAASLTVLLLPRAQLRLAAPMLTDQPAPALVVEEVPTEEEAEAEAGKPRQVLLDRYKKSGLFIPLSSCRCLDLVETVSNDKFFEN